MAGLSFRRRPRKSKNPCRARFDSIQDELLFCPSIEKTVPFKKSSVNKGKKIVLLARKSSDEDRFGFCKLTENAVQSWESRGNRMVRLARNTKISSVNLDDHRLLDQEPFLKQKLAASKESCEVKTNGQRKRLVAVINFHDQVTLQKNQRQLPLELKNYMKELGATGDPVLVIEKKLSSSDVNTGLQRLSIPVKQVLNHGFLTEEERSRFNIDNKQEEINAILIEPSLAQSGIKFKKWYMGKSEVYVLVSGWNEVVKRNGLKPETAVQLWSFKRDSQLYFALARL